MSMVAHWTQLVLHSCRPKRKSWRNKKRRCEQIYPFVWSPRLKRNSVGSSSRCPQLVQPWRAAAAPRSAVRALEMTDCILPPKCALPPGLVDTGGKTRRGRVGFPDVRYVPLTSQKWDSYGTGRMGSRWTLRDETAPRIPPNPHPLHTSRPLLSLSPASSGDAQ